MIEIRVYAKSDGREPFTEWLRGIRDGQVRARIRMRLARVENGNLGDCKSVGAGVSELRIDHGPGYRVYLARRGTLIVLLLSGGIKSTQPTGVETAKAYLKEWEERGKA